MRRVQILCLPLILSACAGQVGYMRPETTASASNNTKIIERQREAVWSSSVPELGKQFFVINNLDKSSGLINISYTGDPERYIDCGRITSHVQNLAGERNYDFPASKAQQTYEILDVGQGYFVINRRMSLEGRVNLVFEEVGPSTTKVTANTKYVVTRNQTVTKAGTHFSQSGTDTVSFNSGGSGVFPPNYKGETPECVSTGVLEQEILAAIK